MVRTFWKIASTYIAAWCLALVVVPAFELFPNSYLKHVMQTTMWATLAALAVLWLIYMAKIISTIPKAIRKEKLPIDNERMNNLRKLFYNLVLFAFIFFLASITTSAIYRYFSN